MLERDPFYIGPFLSSSVSSLVRLSVRPLVFSGVSGTNVEGVSLSV